MANDKKFIGLFNNQTEVIRKIEELKDFGYSEDDIYAVAKHEDQISMVRGRTGADTEAAHDDSWMTKFMSFLTGDDEIRRGLNNMGLTDEETDRYYSDIHAGKILLYVDKDYDKSYDNESYAGVTDPNLGPTPFGVGLTSDERNPGRPDGTVEGVKADRVPQMDIDGDNEKTLKLHEEQLEVDKSRVKTGEVRVDKDVVEDEQTVNVNVEREEVYVERRPVNKNADSFDATSTLNEDDSISIPITEERVEVTKKPVVTEEVVIGKRTVQDTETIKDTVKREEATIDREGSSAADDLDDDMLSKKDRTTALGKDKDLTNLDNRSRKTTDDTSIGMEDKEKEPLLGRNKNNRF